MTMDDEYGEGWTLEEKTATLEFLDAPELQALTKAERARVISVLKGLGTLDRKMLNAIWGQTPSQTALIMAEEFVRRFSPDSPPEYRRFILKRLSPSHTWATLDLRIATLAKKLYHIADMPEALDFWDKMRYLLWALPHRNPPRKEAQPKESIKTSLRLQRPKYHWCYSTCALCWRVVPINPEARKRKRPLCFEHDLAPGDPIYRKHDRLRPMVLAMTRVLADQLKVEYPPSITEAAKRLQHRETNCFHLTSPESPLKNLREYMVATIEGTGDSEEQLLTAFHGPFPKGLESTYLEAMQAVAVGNAQSGRPPAQIPAGTIDAQGSSVRF
jgi:hypothetical protein